ncbi:hypothetical protein [uncultured Capnocytophaga sp.]|uniref:hypothetical protein n=1 Tax=uncultured Capnocytophaga sp. TaxID=159273 RepID=UPI0028E19FDD|nr:hypothetical protein [uncultured Capnocytophaga sp.]
MKASTKYILLSLLVEYMLFCLFMHCVINIESKTYVTAMGAIRTYATITALYIPTFVLAYFIGQKLKCHLYSRFKNFILGVLLIFVFYITTFWLTMMCATYFLCPEDDRRYCMEITQFVVFGYTMYGVCKWLFVFVALLLGSLLVMTSNKFLKKNTDNS